MISYELAKKLKDNGFAVGGDSRFFYNKDGYLCNLEMQIWECGEKIDKRVKLNDEDVYIPTLSELIESCGENFFDLQRIGKSVCKECGNIRNELREQPLWIATHNLSATAYSGKLPEEAVANFWLELNKKY